jgi:hypothetical protein
MFKLNLLDDLSVNFIGCEISNNHIAVNDNMILSVVVYMIVMKL